MPPDTKDKIVYAAMMLFAQKGYGSTSVADILQAAGVNAGSLYYFFPGKQDVLLAVLDAYSAAFIRCCSSRRGKVSPIRSSACSRCSRGIASPRVHGVHVRMPDRKHRTRAPRARPAVRQLLASNFVGWLNAIEQCFIDAGDRLPADVDRRALAVFALTTMEGGVMISRTDRTLDAFDDAVRMLRDYVDRLQHAGR